MLIAIRTWLLPMLLIHSIPIFSIQSCQKHLPIRSQLEPPVTRVQNSTDPYRPICAWEKVSGANRYLIRKEKSDEEHYIFKSGQFRPDEQLDDGLHRYMVFAGNSNEQWSTPGYCNFFIIREPQIVGTTLTDSPQPTWRVDGVPDALSYQWSLDNSAWQTIQLNNGKLVAPHSIAPGQHKMKIRATLKHGFSPSATQSFTISERLSPIESEIVQLMDDYQLTGIHIAFYMNGKSGIRRTFALTLGKADIKNDLAYTEDSVIRVASISKLITAVALFHEVDRAILSGKIRSVSEFVNSDASDYLGFPFRHPLYPERTITVKNIMVHTASLGDTILGENSKRMLESGREIPPISETFSVSGRFFRPIYWLDKEPGSEFHYSNEGPALVAAILERMAHKSFDQYTRDEIFLPLKMNSSYFNPDRDHAQNTAIHYRWNNYRYEITDLGASRFIEQYGRAEDFPEEIDIGHYQPGTNPSIFNPWGGLHASARDMEQLLQMMLGNGQLGPVKILEPSTLDYMEQVHMIYPDQSSGLFFKEGLQIHMEDRLMPGFRMLGHNGRAYGALGSLFWEKRKRFGLYFMINGGKDHETRKASLPRLQQIHQDLFNILYRYFVKGKINP